MFGCYCIFNFVASYERVNSSYCILTPIPKEVCDLHSKFYLKGPLVYLGKYTIGYLLLTESLVHAGLFGKVYNKPLINREFASYLKDILVLFTINYDFRISGGDILKKAIRSELLRHS